MKVFDMLRHGRSCWFFPLEWDWEINSYKQVLGLEER